MSEVLSNSIAIARKNLGHDIRQLVVDTYIYICGNNISFRFSISDLVVFSVDMLGALVEHRGFNEADGQLVIAEQWCGVWLKRANVIEQTSHLKYLREYLLCG